MRGVFGKYFLPFCDFSYHSLDSVFCRSEVFDVSEVQIISYLWIVPLVL